MLYILFHCDLFSKLRVSFGASIVSARKIANAVAVGSGWAHKYVIYQCMRRDAAKARARAEILPVRASKLLYSEDNDRLDQNRV